MFTSTHDFEEHPLAHSFVRSFIRWLRVHKCCLSHIHTHILNNLVDSHEWMHCVVCVCVRVYIVWLSIYLLNDKYLNMQLKWMIWFRLILAAWLPHTYRTHQLISLSVKFYERELVHSNVYILSLLSLHSTDYERIWKPKAIKSKW